MAVSADIRPVSAGDTPGPCAQAGHNHNRRLARLAWLEWNTAAAETAVGAGKATAVALVLVAVAASDTVVAAELLSAAVALGLVQVGRRQRRLVALAAH